MIHQLSTTPHELQFVTEAEFKCLVSWTISDMQCMPNFFCSVMAEDLSISYLVEEERKRLLIFWSCVFHMANLKLGTSLLWWRGLAEMVRANVCSMSGDRGVVEPSTKWNIFCKRIRDSTCFFQSTKFMEEGQIVVMCIIVAKRRVGDGSSSRPWEKEGWRLWKTAARGLVTRVFVTYLILYKMKLLSQQMWELISYLDYNGVV